MNMRKTLRMLGCTLLALAATPLPALAATHTPPADEALTPADIEAVVGLMVFRGCAHESPRILGIFKDLPAGQALDKSGTDRICACTAKASLQGKRMQDVFRLPVDQIKPALQDHQLKEYLTGKIASSMMICAGQALDQLLDPLPANHDGATRPTTGTMAF